MQLIGAANQEAKDMQMVLTGVDYQIPDDMFDQKKIAVCQLFGEQISGSYLKTPEGVHVKTEDVNQGSMQQKRGFSRGSRGRGGRSRAPGRGGG